ncbi:MAG: hypothetical protein WCI77_01685 [Candidatus Omnitrophota bacterium]
MRTYLLILFSILAVSFCGVVFAQGADENITITTFYPSPKGIFKTMEILNGNSRIQMNNADGFPNIDFNNNATETPYDYRIYLIDDNYFGIRGGASRTGSAPTYDINSGVRFTDRAGNPNRIEVGEIWICY